MPHLIESHPDALDGDVRTLDKYSSADFPPNSAILCRNNSPLVSFAYTLLMRDIPCRILGRDIGKQLSDIVTKCRATNIEDLIERLKSWRDREVLRAEGESRSPERILDQHDCLRFFIQSLDHDSQTIASLLAKIDLMFTDDVALKNRVTLSSIHKAKGLEYPVVFILDRHLCPSKFAAQPWQQQQERNLMYVAITRSMDKLFYISSDCWDDTNTIQP